MAEQTIVLVIAFLLDCLFGDPHWLYHPVQAIGFLISKTEKLLRYLLRISPEREKDCKKKQVAGVILVIIVLAFSTAIPAFILYIAGKISPLLRIVISSIMCYQLLAMKSLKVESMKVYKELANDNIEGARKAVSMIVGRDTERLDKTGITKATVETVAENTSDGVIAPLLFMLVFGTIGGFFYKAVNTMDSMIGYKNDTYCYFGTAGAKLDDIVNYIPARISAYAMIIASKLLGFNAKNAYRIFKRDRYCHASPNSAQTEATCAGALEIQLAGDAWYFGKICKKPTIGDSIRPIEIEDIKRVNRLLYGTSMIVLVVGVFIRLFIMFYLQR